MNNTSIPTVDLKRQLVSIAELAPFLGLTVRHVRKLRTQRLIPYIQLGRLIRYDPNEVLKAIQRLTIKEQGAEAAEMITTRRRRRKPSPSAL